MTQAEVNKVFETELGRQLDVLFSTADDRLFIRRQEAQFHTEGMLDEGTEPLADKTVQTWFREH